MSDLTFNEILRKNYELTVHDKKGDDGPATYLDVILSIAILFKKGKDWIDAIKSELDKMNQLLRTIVRMLEELEIYIDEKFRFDAENDLISWVNTIIENIERYRALNENEMNEIRNVYIQLVHARNYYMNYGFCFPNSLALSLRLEKELLEEILKEPSDRRIVIYKKYKDHFDSCIAEHLNGSIGQRLKQVKDIKAQLEIDYPIHDEVEFKALTISYSEGGMAGNEGGHDPISYFSFDILITIKGSLNDPKISSRLSETREGRETVIARNHSQLVVDFITDLKNKYSQASEIYKSNFKALKILQVQFDGCEQYRQIATKLIDES